MISAWVQVVDSSKVTQAILSGNVGRQNGNDSRCCDGLHRGLEQLSEQTFHLEIDVEGKFLVGESPAIWNSGETGICKFLKGQKILDYLERYSSFICG